MIHPNWQLSAAAAVALALLVALTRGRDGAPFPSLRAFGAEFALVMTLLGVWQFVGRYVRGDVTGAIRRAETVVAVQRALHLPDEAALQRLVLPHHLLVSGSNVYYAYAHLNGMAAFLLWMWWRHRDRYPAARLTVVLTTLICLLVQLVPVAPPRLMPSLGFVDTALQYGQSVYGDYTGGLSNQLSAMPSVHVAWALIVAWYAMSVTRSRWRWLGPAHAVLTIAVITVTANHWWLDGIVAAIILTAVGLVQRLALARPDAPRAAPPAAAVAAPQSSESSARSYGGRR